MSDNYWLDYADKTFLSSVNEILQAVQCGTVKVDRLYSPEGIKLRAQLSKTNSYKVEVISYIEHIVELKDHE